MKRLLAWARRIWPRHKMPEPPAELYVRYNGPLGTWDAREEQFPLENVRGMRIARYRLVDVGEIRQVYESTREVDNEIRIEGSKWRPVVYPMGRD